MKILRLPRKLWTPLRRLLGYGSLGAFLILVIVFVVYLNGRPDIDPWHKLKLDDFTVDSGITSFEQYLTLEEQLFNALDQAISRFPEDDNPSPINRYQPGSFSDPEQWPQNFNKTYWRPSDDPVAGVLLLHGLSDSPYSLRHVGDALENDGASVLGLRIPGHGTVPAGLRNIRWQDMYRAVVLAIQFLKQQVGDRPIIVVGYSTGATLGLVYSLNTIDDPELLKVDQLVLLSPAVRVSPAAFLAVWQARLGYLLGLEKLEWNSISLEYDPFKYQSFAVNAGDLIYQLTDTLNEALAAAQQSGSLARMPPVLAFQSAVDATVNATAVESDLFARLKGEVHELVFFDVNYSAAFSYLFRNDPGAWLSNLLKKTDLPYTLSVVWNIDGTSRVEWRSRTPGSPELEIRPLSQIWPQGVYSLSHVAVPFPVSDPLYGDPDNARTELRLGALALRGERSLLRISASEMLRQRHNPFFRPMVQRIRSSMRRVVTEHSKQAE